MEYLSNDYEDHSNEHENNHKLCDETGHPVLSLPESQWKLRQKHDQNFQMKGKSEHCRTRTRTRTFVEQILASGERNEPKK